MQVQLKGKNQPLVLRFFGDSRPWVATVTAGIRVWLDGVGQAGMHGTAEQMNGRTCKSALLYN